jgi:chromosome segregation ATPase
MMEDEKLQLLIGLFGELNKDINDVKTELKTNINDVKTEINAGQEELKVINDVKTDINDVKTELKNNIENSISAVKDEVSAVKKELSQEINDFQERIKNIKAGQAEFEERVTCTADTHFKNGSSMVEQQTRNLREDFSRNMEATRQDVEATRCDLEATQRDLESHLAALEDRTRRTGGSSAGTNADKDKPPTFDGSTSWIVFQRQFDAAAIHNDWTPREKDAHILSVLQGQAAHVLHSVPAEASYEDIVGALRD